jgi:hypothetical protein
MKSEGECDDRQTPASYKLTNPLMRFLLADRAIKCIKSVAGCIGWSSGGTAGDELAGGTKVRLVGF